MQTKLTVYHGSNHVFDTIDFSKSKDKRDFGRGFYTTTLRKQAEDWAQALYDRYGGGGKYIYTKVNDQISLHTQNALYCLKLVRLEELL